MTFINKIISIAKYPLFLLISILSIIFPKNKELWVFGAWFGRGYFDNSRYLFEYVYANEPEVHAVWLTRDNKIYEAIKSAGKEGYLVKSLKGFWMALRASVVFISSGIVDVNPIACYGATKVQLWHGIPLKKIGLDDRLWENPELPFFYKMIRSIKRKRKFFLFPKYDFIVSSSPLVSKRLATAFGVEEDKVILTGYPRNDIILKHNPPSVKKIEDLKTKWGITKLILFAPTFRVEGRKGNLFREMDLDKLHQLLVLNSAAFFIKLHYIQREQMVLPISEINKYHIHLFSEEEAPDINYLLPQIDILITDYSSVYFDFLLLNRPIIFTPFDLEEYTKIDREFYEDYEQATPGPKCKNWDEVIKALDNILKGKDIYKDLRREKLRIYNTFIDTMNCERIVKKVKRYLNRNKLAI